MEPLEIEKKYIIRIPNKTFFELYPPTHVYTMEQSYLPDKKRIRMREEFGMKEYFFTEKKKLTDMTRVELEKNISKEEYDAYLSSVMEGSHTIHKTRYAIPFENHHLEIDVYSFWKQIASLEIELQREDESFQIPKELDVLFDATSDQRFSNFALALSIPKEEEILLNDC